MVSSTIMLALVVGTLVLFTGLGIWFSRGAIDSVEDLITARNSIGQGRLTATLIASVMGVWILLSAPEAGATFGIAAVVGYGIGEAIPMIVYTKLGPRIRRVIPRGHSLTEYALGRYGSAMYAFVLVVSVLYMFVFLAAELTGISLALHYVAAVPQWQTAVLVGGFVLLYTGYGGLRASIRTDAIQTVILLPLLVGSVAAILLTLGGPRAVHGEIVSANPTLFDLGHVSGVRFGLALVFAILGAELVNQTWWQRIYAAESTDVLERGFRTAAIANGFVLFVATLLGLVAVGYADIVTDLTSEHYNAGIALFVLLEGAFSEWIVLGVVLLALVLVMSTVDTLFNALSSLVTVDLPRLLDEPDDAKLQLGARALTAIVAVLAIAVSLRARSVLRLFLVADLLGAAIAFPLVYGLFSRRLSGQGALVSSLIGLAVGSAFFPFPFGLHGRLDALLGGYLPAADPTYLIPFASAFLISAGFALLVARLSSYECDLDRLSIEIHSLDEPHSVDGHVGDVVENSNHLNTEGDE